MSETIILTPEQAKMLAGLQHAASTDNGRNPMLRSILLEWTSTELTAVATNSYIMARRVFQLDQDGDTPNDEGSILIEAKPFAKAVSETAKASPLGVLMEIHDGELRIIHGHGSVTVFRAVEGKFPEWRRFYSEDLLTEGEGKLPALAPKHLERVLKVAKGTPVVKSEIPLRLAWGETADKGDLQPFRFEQYDQTRGNLSIIIMPVKV